ncbi:hypothetical protein EDB83DRAFT_2322287 [Lactarius deliciosus]|nr:hypothetical protein EDB83DRAFT_2322287 [Lactarius deliciosus]
MAFNWPPSSSATAEEQREDDYTTENVAGHKEDEDRCAEGIKGEPVDIRWTASWTGNANAPARRCNQPFRGSLNCLIGGRRPNMFVIVSSKTVHRAPLMSGWYMWRVRILLTPISGRFWADVGPGCTLNGGGLCCRLTSKALGCNVWRKEEEESQVPECEHRERSKDVDPLVAYWKDGIKGVRYNIRGSGKGGKEGVVKSNMPIRACPAAKEGAAEVASTTNLNTLLVALTGVVNAIRPPAPSATAATEFAMNMIEDEEGFSNNDRARAANAGRDGNALGKAPESQVAVGS